MQFVTKAAYKSPVYSNPLNGQRLTSMFDLSTVIKAAKDRTLSSVSLLEMCYDLPTVSIHKKSELPNVACVYFVSNQKEVVYIGQTRNLKIRFQSGHHKIHDFRSCNGNVTWLNPEENNLLTLEQLLISSVQPKMNKAGVTCGKIYPSSNFDCFDYVHDMYVANNKPLIEKISITPDITHTVEKPNIIMDRQKTWIGSNTKKLNIQYDLNEDGELFDNFDIQYHGLFLTAVARDNNIYFNVGDLADNLNVDNDLTLSYVDRVESFVEVFYPAINARQAWFSKLDAFVTLYSLSSFLEHIKAYAALEKYKAHFHETS